MDYYKDGNCEIFQNKLKEIKPFRKYNAKEIPLGLLEKLAYKYECKYAIMINYICPVFIPEERLMYSVTFRNTNKDVRKIFPVLYGSSLYELFCKICLFYYDEITIKENIDLKNWEEK